MQPVASRDWLLHLHWLLRDRRAALRELRQAGHGARSRDLATRGERYGLAGTIWWIGMSVTLLLVIAGAALLLPTRRSSARTVEDGMWEAPPLLIAGAVLLCLLAVLPVPAVVRESPLGFGAALMAGAFALVTLAYNATRIEELLATEHGGRTGAYFSAAGVALLASAVLAVRSREKPPHHRVHWRQTAREVRRHVRWLQRYTPVPEAPPPGGPAWGDALSRLGPEADATVIAQARALGPWHFLVAACYDGEKEVPTIRVPPVEVDRPTAVRHPGEEETGAGR
ncbi:hypothetical protein MWU75_13700 [Ornithinimicrobium sp. F0845]|uniref:hypothetical protein n=1 Tax=Ornithinimicrobium sp. F0845 TaxID=2926412 RepID=UPI001FF173B0|nr:hypothetical protein [Ornithinimicrobium sp. F0845]MCK0113197.1 hypothetical protein [Ornithinimicrobium sp. F0845]